MKVSRVHTYPALMLSSSQPLDWPVLGWALLAHWGRVTQNHMPEEKRKVKEGRQWKSPHREKEDKEIRERADKA